VRDDDAAPFLAAATLGLWLGRASDRLALGGALARRVRGVVALRARAGPALLLLRGRRRGGLPRPGLFGARGPPRGCSPGPPEPPPLVRYRGRTAPPSPGSVLLQPLALSRLSFGSDREDASDLALRELQPRAVLERTRRRLEAQVEQLLPPIGERVL